MEGNHPAKKQPGEWSQKGACRGLPTRWWYPNGGEEEGDPKEKAMALAVCRKCPVVTECLAYSLETRERGIWGAKTETQRDRMRRARLRAEKKAAQAAAAEEG